MITARKPLPGEPGKLFQPVYACKGPEQRPVRAPVSVPVKLSVRFRRSGSSGSQQNTFSRLGGLDLLHPKVVDLALPYLQSHGHALRYTNTSLYLLTGMVPSECIPVGYSYRSVLLITVA